MSVARLSCSCRDHFGKPFPRCRVCRESGFLERPRTETEQERIDRRVARIMSDPVIWESAE